MSAADTAAVPGTSAGAVRLAGVTGAEMSPVGAGGVADEASGSAFPPAAMTLNVQDAAIVIGRKHVVSSQA